MTLQALHYFVTLARIQNFTQAARECYVSQPALSRAISELEAELGCRLIRRTTRSLALTGAGEVCLREAEKILEQCRGLKLQVAQEGKRTQRHLRVGYFSQNHLYRFHRRLGMDRDAFYLSTEYDTLFHLEEKLRKGELDVILIPEISRNAVPGLDCGYVQRSRLFVLLQETHPLAGREAIGLGELKQERFIAWDEREMPGINQAHSAACQKRGFLPAYVASAKKMGDMVMLVETWGAVALIAQTLAEAVPAGFCAVLVEDSEEVYGVLAAWRADNPSPALKRLKAILSDL